MAERTYRLEIVTPEKRLLSDDSVVSLVAPGHDGYVGVLVDHAPLMTELGVGEIDVRRSDGTMQYYAIAGGFLEVLDNVVTVLADVAEAGSDIDRDRAEQARRRAEERLAGHSAEVDADRARAALMRALNRLSVAGRARGTTGR